MWSALMIRIRKIYGLHGKNHQIIFESGDVTPLTHTHESKAVLLRPNSQNRLLLTLESTKVL